MTLELSARAIHPATEPDLGARSIGGDEVSSATPASHDFADLELTAGERWFCVHTLPKKELYAEANLKRQDFRCFVPKVIKTVRHARRTKTALAALFPRYLFIVIDLDRDQWRSILGTFGVATLIMEDDLRPRSAPVGVVESLIEATGTAGSLDFRDQLKVGQDVRILTGPFADQMGRLARLDDQGRVAVLLEIMGAERLVRTERAALQPVA